MHPPTCPHPECDGKTFTSSKGLKAHLVIHGEKEEERIEKGLETDGGYTTDGRGKRKKRLRRSIKRKKGMAKAAREAKEEEDAEEDATEKSGTDWEEEGRPSKKPKLAEVKDELPWKCTVQEGCTKAFHSVDKLVCTPCAAFC